MNHKLACEVIARRVVQKFPADRQHVVLSTRYSHIESDGDVSLALSAIELASDLHCPIFLSSGESQKTVFALWKGHVSLSHFPRESFLKEELKLVSHQNLSWYKAVTLKGKETLELCSHYRFHWTFSLPVRHVVYTTWKPKGGLGKHASWSNR